MRKMKGIGVYCKLCGRRMFDHIAPGLNPLLENCGGDCWGCIGKIEAEGGYEPSIIQYNKEIDAGWRKGPKITIEGD